MYTEELIKQGGTWGGAMESLKGKLEDAPEAIRGFADQASNKFRELTPDVIQYFKDRPLLWNLLLAGGLTAGGMAINKGLKNRGYKGVPNYAPAAAATALPLAYQYFTNTGLGQAYKRFGLKGLLMNKQDYDTTENSTDYIARAKMLDKVRGVERPLQDYRFGEQDAYTPKSLTGMLPAVKDLVKYQPNETPIEQEVNLEDELKGIQ